MFTLIYINEICPLKYTDNPDNETNKMYPYKSTDFKVIFNLKSYEAISDIMLHGDIGIHFIKGKRGDFILSEFISKDEINTRTIKNIFFKDKYFVDQKN